MHRLKNLVTRYVLRVKTQLYKTYVRLFGRIVFKDKFGLMYYLYSNTRISSTLVRNVRTDDEGVLNVIGEVISDLRSKPDRTQPLVCFDVGAYMGIVSLFLSKQVGSEGTVYSFEPEPVTYQRLCHNIELNHSQNIRPNRAAMWHQAGLELPLAHLPDDPGNGYLVDGNVEVEVDRKLDTVSTIAIDTFMAAHKIDAIDLLKIDAEGKDGEIVQDAQEAIKQGKISYIIFEFIDMGACSLYLELRKLGFEIYWIETDGCSIEPLTADLIQKKSWGNCLAISPEISLQTGKISTPDDHNSQSYDSRKDSHAYHRASSL